MVLLYNSLAIKVNEIITFIHHSQVKPWHEESSEPAESEVAPKSYSCEPLEDLKLLIKKVSTPLFHCHWNICINCLGTGLYFETPPHWTATKRLLLYFAFPFALLPLYFGISFTFKLFKIF
jgi:hypothetical protein